MIKRLPGWLNFIILWALYFLVFWLLSLAIKDTLSLVLCASAVYAGGYLAKWRFYDDGWHFW